MTADNSRSLRDDKSKGQATTKWKAIAGATARSTTTAKATATAKANAKYRDLSAALLTIRL
jgi:hypothetical protein